MAMVQRRGCLHRITLPVRSVTLTTPTQVLDFAPAAQTLSSYRLDGEAELRLVET
jgi:hypothetical protein